MEERGRSRIGGEPGWIGRGGTRVLRYICMHIYMYVCVRERDSERVPVCVCVCVCVRVCVTVCMLSVHLSASSLAMAVHCRVTTWSSPVFHVVAPLWSAAAAGCTPAFSYAVSSALAGKL